jgi:flagellar M-ring protein FliF
LGLPQRAGIIGVAVLALALAIYAATLAQTPEYATLFAGLSEEDAATVVDKLKELQIPYRLGAGGGTVQVPQRQVYETRLEMAKEGLPKGSTVGFELFDSGGLNNLGMTDFMQRLQYQRALEGELARTIATLEPLASARVHLVIPEPTLYSDAETEPSASVVVQLKPKAELTRGQVQAVTHLVASSIEGLKPGNITLVDVAGNVLSMAGGDGTRGGGLPDSMQASTTQLDMQHAYEADLERRLQAVLDQAVGPGAGIVRVSAAFNWDQKQTNSETYVPATDGTTAIRSEQIQEETSGTSATTASGVPGQDSNTVPGYPSADPARTPQVTDGSYLKRNTTRNYEVSKVIQTVTQAPGSVKRLSVAVLLSDQVAEEQATRLQTMLSTAAGLDASRGDTVAVERLPFVDRSATSPLDAVATPSSMPQVWTLARLAGLLLAILLLLRFARMTFNDLSSRLAGENPRIRVIQPEAPLAQQLPAHAESAPPGGTLPVSAEAGAGRGQGRLPTADRPELRPPGVPPTEEEIDELPPPLQENVWREHLAVLARRRPELVADLIQNWLAEG